MWRWPWPAANRIVDDGEEQRESKRRKSITGEAVPGGPTGELGLLLRRYADEDSHQPETATGCGDVKGDLSLFAESSLKASYVASVYRLCSDSINLLSRSFCLRTIVECTYLAFRCLMAL